jgi:hypothetical protein
MRQPLQTKREASFYTLAVALCATAMCALGCLPIPVTRQALAFPATEITVVGADGEPLEGATVALYRNEIHPHWKSEALDSREATTDAKGGVSFAHEMYDKTDMPLMMHGVGFNVWHVCVEKQGHATRTFRLFEQGEEVVRRPDSALLATYEQLVEGAALTGVKITLEAAAEDTEAAEAAKCSAKEVSREFNTSETTGIDIMPRYNPKH